MCNLLHNYKILEEDARRSLFWAYIQNRTQAAGVGKSHLITATYQACLKYHNTKSGQQFEDTNVILLAPIGKAAYNIKGSTIHSAMKIWDGTYIGRLMSAVDACYKVFQVLYWLPAFGNSLTLWCTSASKQRKLALFVSLERTTISPTHRHKHTSVWDGTYIGHLISASQNLAYKPLTTSKLNTFRVQFQHLKLIIIDEISMVGAAMFNYVHKRLQELMGKPIPFGGVSIICVGDLYQLRPVLCQSGLTKIYFKKELHASSPECVEPEKATMSMGLDPTRELYQPKGLTCLFQTSYL